MLQGTADPFGYILPVGSLGDQCLLSPESVVLVPFETKGTDVLSSHFFIRGQSSHITTVNSKSRLGVPMVALISEVGAFPSAWIPITRNRLSVRKYSRLYTIPVNRTPLSSPTIFADQPCVTSFHGT